MTYQGKSPPKYLAWHPIYHIHWDLARPSNKGDASQSAYLRIVEAFGGDMNCLIESTEYVEKLYETGIRLVRKVAGVEVFSLQHDFHSVPNGTKYISQMVVGTARSLVKTLFNTIMRPFIFTEIMAQAWLKHNVDEVGNFEFFLPEHYRLHEFAPK